MKYLFTVITGDIYTSRIKDDVDEGLFELNSSCKPTKSYMNFIKKMNGNIYKDEDYENAIVFILDQDELANSEFLSKKDLDAIVNVKQLKPMNKKEILKINNDDLLL